MAIISTAAASLIGAIIAAGTSTATGVAKSHQTGKLAAESRKIAEQSRADMLFANEMQRRQSDKSLKLSRDNLMFQQREAGLNRLAQREATEEAKKQRKIDRALGLFSGQQGLKNNINQLWSNMGNTPQQVGSFA